MVVGCACNIIKADSVKPVGESRKCMIVEIIAVTQMHEIIDQKMYVFFIL